ncbi:MAG: S9 family peptidase [Gammaproteobacteria bacterium]|nr:S9 family peptidase [Gammaproteobacteria bacterium]
MRHCLLLILMLLCAGNVLAVDKQLDTLQPLDVFELEFAVDPRISPDGSQIAYVRRSMDIMTDRALNNIWMIASNGRDHRPVLSGSADYASPRWSPDGNRLAYVTEAGARGAEIHVRWMDSGQTALLTNLARSPGAITWSPDGRYLAFTMFVASAGPSLATPPDKPEGAEWAPPVTIIEDMPYRVDGAGYLETGYTHVFVVPADGGTPRQVTAGDYNHNGPLSWSPDSRLLVFSANRVDNPLREPVESELWQANIENGELRALTTRNGPDFAPAFSADGRYIAYLGFDDRALSSQVNNLYLLDRRTDETKALLPDLDRPVGAVAWAGKRNELYIRYDDRGRRTLARVSLGGELTELTDDLGGASAGRPYTSGSFSVAGNGTVAYTRGTAIAPSEIALLARGARQRTLTSLNDDLLAHRDLATVEEITWQSSADDLDIHGWIVKPPGFDPSRKYPLILEIHGGPFAAYGPHFSPEVQLYAAAGYVVLYTNPRGSSSYGQAFMDEIHLNYPGQDYDDLMSGVDAVIAQGYVDSDNLFVTGGSGGGVLSSWIVGKTDRFRAAVVQKPVVNWASFALTSDITAYVIQYWFDSAPWEDPDEYWRRSPLSLVGNVSTPTMLITGEQDFRTPMPESEQFYQALKLRGVDTALVRVPERSHNLVARPSHLVAKAANIIAWFDRYRESDRAGD